MKIESVRLGFASNSSSSHSIIITEQKPQDQYSDDNEFGWKTFILNSKKAKQNYLAQSLFNNLKIKLDENTAEIVVRALFEGIKKDILKDGYIDHQSQMELPSYYSNRNSISLDFFKSMAGYIENKESLSILGGNDNSDGYGFYNNLIKEQIQIPLKDDYYLIARHEGEHKWTLFNRSTGAKLRMDFDYGLKTDMEISIKSPELIDLKITDHCMANCDFCYQDSTYEGKHGDYNEIQGLFYSMESAEVFEVAIGGGEPTTHPKFADILRTAYNCNVIPNFTTYSTDWLNNEEVLKVVIKYVGCVAVSIHNKRDIWKYSRIAEALNICGYSEGKQIRVSIQMIIGQMPYSEIKEIIELISTYPSYPKPVVTLLGHKTTGRGNNATGLSLPYDIEWIHLVHFAKKQNINLGIDAVLVEKFKGNLIGNGIKKELMVAKEGVHSFYIDAVNKEWGISSYCDEMKAYQTPYDLFKNYEKDKN